MSLYSPRGNRKKQPVPPGRALLQAGHHWLAETDYEGRILFLRVMQWAPCAKRWCRSGEVASGEYVECEGWKYISECPVPEL